MFCDETGEALNEAAKQLVLDALAADRHSLESNGGVAPALGPILSSIPVVECTEGAHKYVQVQLTHPNEPGAVLVVRSYSSCTYHAENYRKLMRMLGKNPATAGVVGRVIGGGRIRFDSGRSACVGVDGTGAGAARATGDGERGGGGGSAMVYGYSKTFGRTPGCNEKTAEIIRANCPGLARVDWSDKGY